MKPHKETFESTLQQFLYHFDSRTVFDDFLTMSICALSNNPLTGKSHDEDLYLQTIAKYKDYKLRFAFPNLFALLTLEMDERVTSDSGNDILGEYYEEHLYQKNTQQFFTPWPVCSFMAKATAEQCKEIDADRPLRILDPCCGSGRMLLAAARENGPSHEYYGIDTDQTCVKMTVLNLFLNGLFHGEALCADALSPEDFRGSYATSFLPFGIFRIAEKEKSLLWHLKKNSFSPTKVITEPLPNMDNPLSEGNQMILF